MEELMTPKKRVGNPNFGKKQEGSDELSGFQQGDIPASFDHKKNYEFELVNTYEIYKPVEEKTGKKIDNIYPPFYILPNVGRAYDDETKQQRKFRFLANEKSIWADEQSKYELKEEAELLALTENQLVFTNGKLFVSGKEENKIKAILIQDECENKVNKIKDRPSAYRLINPDTAIRQSLDGIEVEMEAINLASKATLEEMKEYAYCFGIAIEQSDEGIRRDFYMAAKSNAKFFLKNFNNPIKKYKYMLFKAIQGNIISPNIVANQLVWVETRKVICEVDSSKDVVSEVAGRGMAGERDIKIMFNELERQEA